MKSEDDTIGIITVPTIHGYDIIEKQAITHLKGEGNQTAIYIVNKATPVIASACLGHYLEILSPVIFMQIHRSYIINLTYLVKFLKGKLSCVRLKKGIVVPVSEDFKIALNTYLDAKR
jgi:two-component system LytT family response regulator